jgi:CBS domain-containing protein
MRVRDVMTYGAIGVSEDASLTEAIETLLRSRVSALLVFDADHALAGILSEGDLLRRSELGTEKHVPRWLEFLLSGGSLAESYAHVHGRKASEVMTKTVITISEDAELSEAVDLMLRKRVKRLPVLRGDAVVGIVARSDLLKGLLAALPKPGAQPSDAEIKRTIQAEMDKLPWAPRASVRVDVVNGTVTYDGAITDERLRDGLRVIAENTAGVVAIRDHMAWIEPNSGFYIPSPEEAKEEADKEKAKR